MTEPPEESSPELERFVEAISEGEPVEWEKEIARRGLDPKTLKALRLIDTASRLHRSGGTARDPGTGEQASDAAGERTWGNLRILGPLGTGEYGEVYRAFDPALRKEVALKLWTASDEPTTIEQQLAEARALARVRHPNVLLVLGADVHDDHVGMWTELLEGVTLEQMLTELGPGHWRELAVYGIDLCRALAAVHAVGLVHGDVKAANVMRERGGRIVLMDFGSAGDAEPGPGSGGGKGTPLAMAPEVLLEHRACPASDLYSLGVLLFRLVAGRYPLHAKSLDDLRAVHASAAGPLPSLRSARLDVPNEFSDAVARALEYDPAKRFASAVEMEQALASALTSGWLGAAGSAPADVAVPRGSRKPPVLAWAAGGAVALAALFAAWWWTRGAPPGAPEPMQFTFDLPFGEHLSHFANLVVSPDGSKVAFACLDSSGTNALWVRRFDSLSFTRVPGTEGAWYPFWSPDSRQVAFFSNGELKRVGLDGDSVRVICHAELGRGGSWSSSGAIVFAASTQGPLMRVPAAGGAPVPATVLDTANSEVSHRWPFFLPDGDHFLYVTTPEVNGAFALYVGSLRSSRRAYVGTIESAATYTCGMVVYMVNQGLEARRFDLHSLRWRGEPHPISAVPGFGGSVAEPHASVSSNGTLVYTFQSARDSRLVWIDVATGTEKTLANGPYFDPCLSPDGRRIAVERSEGSGRSNVWMVAAATGAAERWTDAAGVNRKPVWSPSGDTIMFASTRNGRYELYMRRTDGSLSERPAYGPAGGLLMWPNDWGRNGEITFDRYVPGSSYNIYELRAGTAVPLVATSASESRSALSADGRWLAFESNRLGSTHIHVLDRVTGEQYVIPGDGGSHPRWARSAGKLFYLTGANDFYEVTPVPGRPPSEWRQRLLFRTGVLAGYDVDADGKRLLCCLKSGIGRPEEVAVLVNLPAAVAKGL